MRLGIRTIKTAIGAGVAIWLAQLMDLEFAVSAGILTILCIDTTKRRSLATSYERGASAICALICSLFFFHWFGYGPFVFTVFVLLFLPVLISIRLQSGFVTSMVIALHVLTVGECSIALAINELLLIFIGVGVALIMNSYMPNLNAKLEGYQQQIEFYIKTILDEFSSYLTQGDRGWNGEELQLLSDLLHQAKSVAVQKTENHVFRHENQYYVYFSMRQKQLDILERMLPIIASLQDDVPQRQMVADFLCELRDRVSPANQTSESFATLHTLRESSKALPLPVSRSEFETRANLFHLLNEMERYLRIKAKLPV